MAGKKFRGYNMDPKAREAKRKKVATQTGGNIMPELVAIKRKEREAKEAAANRYKAGPNSPAPGTYKPRVGSYGNIGRYSPVLTTNGSLLGENLPETTVEGKRRTVVDSNRGVGSSRRVGQSSPSTRSTRSSNRYAGSSVRAGQGNQSRVKGKERTSGSSLRDTKASAQQKATTHTIKKGETLGSIAKKYGVDWRALADANGIDNPNLIYAGVKLKIDPATMGKKNRRKVGVNNPKAPGMHLGENNFPTPTREEAITTNMPMNRGALSVDLPEDYY